MNKEQLPDPNYVARWEAYRAAAKEQRQLGHLAAIIAVIAAGFTINGYLMFLLPVIFLAAQFKWQRPKRQLPGMLLCPRCGKPFFGVAMAHLDFLFRRCVHCGLPKYATHDVDRTRGI